MTSYDFAASAQPMASARDPLASRTWDRGFLLGGAWLLPVPIVAFYLLRACGLPTGTCEDLVTLLVMVPLGGPHVVATFGRTLFNWDFWRREPVLAAASVAVVLIAAGAAIASAFFDLRLGGAPPMTYVLTFFFFWAGLHVLQQHCYAAACIADRSPRERRGRWGHLDHVVMVLSLYPVSLFRMSMLASTAGSGAADPDALATRIVMALGGSREFADEYAFHIGRASPILPELVRHPAIWIGVTAAFVGSFAMFLVRSWRDRRRGLEFGTRGRLVLTVALSSALVPLLPNLDTAFQGINAWHSMQYLGLAWLMHRGAVRRCEVNAAWLVQLAAPERALRAYGIALSMTLGLVAAILGGAWLLQSFGGARFSFFGHDIAPLAADGAPLYRPGGVLLCYYLLGFGFLLVHYLQDTVLFLRRRV